MKFSLELIITPRSFTVSTCVIVLVPSEKGEVILWEPFVIMLHLEYEMLNCQSEAHCNNVELILKDGRFSVGNRGVQLNVISEQRWTHGGICKLSTLPY